MTTINVKEVNRMGIIQKILLSVLLILACFSIYTYTDYLYGVRALDIITGYTPEGDYLEKYILHNGKYFTKNSERIYSRKRYGLTYYPKERICTENFTKLGIDSTGANWLKTELGPIPVGTRISSYEIYSSASYVSGWRPYIKTYYKLERKYSIYKDHFGGEHEIFNGYQKVPEHHTEYSPVYQKYYYSHCFSTFDINEEMSSFFNDNDTIIYNQFLDKIVNELVNSYGITPIEGSIKGHRAIIYDINDKTPIRRVIFCVNERMYILETKSAYNLSNLSYNYCRNLDLSPIYKLENEWDRKVILPIVVMFCICCVMLLSELFILRRRKNCNKLAVKLYKNNLLLLVLSFIALYYCINDEYSNYPCQHPGIVSRISISVIINMIVLLWLKCKTKQCYKTDWAVIPWIKQHCYNKLKQEKSRRLYLSLVVYPVIVLCATPLSAYAIFYGIVITGFIKLVVFLNKWSKWIEEGDIKPMEKN